MSKQLVGRVITQHIHEFYEQPCASKDAHAAHLFMTGGSGGGVVVRMGPIRGEHLEEDMILTETWCPGVRGTIEV